MKVNIPLETDVTDGIAAELVVLLDNVDTAVIILASVIDDLENICITLDDNDLVGVILVDDVLDAVVNTVDVVLSVIVSNMMAGMVPVTALPRGVIKSRLTALAV